jgi:UDP-GlcNAc:undecaprenyl-phosphate GlcNAc-1-phosphate transferase
MGDIRVWVSALGAAAVTVGAIVALRPLAFAVDLLDRPGGHKTHHGAVPLVGGLGMLFGLVVGLTSNGNPIGDLQPYLFSASLLTVVGLFDDRFNIAPILRLTAQFVAVLPMFFGAGVQLTSFGDLIGSGPLDVSGYSLFATALVAMAAINAFNMLDGLDGLAGGVALTATVLLLCLSPAEASIGTTLLAVVLSASIIGFLVFNLPVRWNSRIRTFMGDGGSTLLGFSLAWLMIGASQGPSRLAAPVTMVWLVLVPTTELIWSVVRRIARGRSPIRADNEQMHQNLLRAGLGVRAVFAAMIGLSLLCGFIGLQLERAHVPDWVSFGLLLSTGILLVLITRRSTAFLPLVPKWLHRRELPIGVREVELLPLE